MRGARHTGRVRAQLSNPTQVLIVGQDAVLLNTRRLILQQDGFPVDTALDREEFDALTARPPVPYRLCILCHTIPEEDRRAFELAARKAGLELYELTESVGPDQFLGDVNTSMSRLSAAEVGGSRNTTL